MGHLQAAIAFVGLTLLQPDFCRAFLNGGSPQRFATGRTRPVDARLFCTPEDGRSPGMDVDIDGLKKLRSEIADLDAQQREAAANGEFGRAGDLMQELDTLRDSDPLIKLEGEILDAVAKGEFERAADLKSARNLLNQLCPVPIVRTNRLMLLSENGRYLVTIGRDGKKMRRFNKRLDASAPTAISGEGKARQIQQPTWSRDGRKIAFVSLTVGQSGMEKAQLVVMEEESMRMLQAVPIEYPPIYMMWSPDDAYLTYLSTGRDGRVHLHYIEVRQEGRSKVKAKVLDTGTPLFYSFCGSDPSSSDLVVHNAERKSIYRYEGALGPNRSVGGLPAAAGGGDVKADGADVPISMAPGTFMAPVGWSVGGRSGCIGVENGFLVTVDVGGRFRRRLVPVRGISSFVLSPDQSRIALLQSDIKSGHYSMSIVEVGEGGAGLDPRMSPLPPVEQRELEGDTIGKAMFFSPDSSKLLVFSTPYPRSDVAVAANAFKSNYPAKCKYVVHDLEGGGHTSFPSFTPRQYFMRLYLPFFDQYAQSFTPWAPDSKAFVFVAQEGVFVQPLPEGIATSGTDAEGDVGGIGDMGAMESITGGEEDGEEKELMVPTMAQLEDAMKAARLREASGQVPKAFKLGKGVEIAVWSWC